MESAWRRYINRRMAVARSRTRRRYSSVTIRDSLIISFPFGKRLAASESLELDTAAADTAARLGGMGGSGKKSAFVPFLATV